MKDLQHLLLPVLLVMCPVPQASEWSSLEAGRGLGKEDSQQRIPCAPIALSLAPSIAGSAWNQRDRGHEARTHPTPYMAYVQGRNQQFCGGFLVAPGWVMTAAQCLAHKPLTVILGAHTVQKREESWQRFEVQQYHCHPGFTSPKKGNDILLLKLKGNATTNNHVRTISFEKAKVSGGIPCSITGWGHMTPAATLRQTPVAIIKQRNCLSLAPGLAENLICGLSASSEGPEKGDAGDPLVCNNKAYGIFSYRHHNWPGFYTHIAPFLPWANSIMKSS
ncbi:granzyme G-like [Strigops habroptila]|uniref:granzyme G-like n=1 Tax=Strigops habroptila TaxID=2489341 RepID=UPI0011CF61AB|nr:granzyme G-like [Strigops habroptila]